MLLVATAAAFLTLPFWLKILTCKKEFDEKSVCSAERYFPVVDRDIVFPFFQ
jgi:hypothetical protein